MLIRPYRPGDEVAQAAIYNAEAAALPGFKPAGPDEILRRYRDADPSPALYAVEGGAVVGYTTLNSNGRVGYPWCLPGSSHAREPLWEALLAEARRRRPGEVWAAYRADWTPVLDAFEHRGFARAREMVNYVAPVGRLPRATALEAGWRIDRLTPADAPEVAALGRGFVADDDVTALRAFYWSNPHFGPDALFALRDRNGRALGIGLAIADPRYADPSQIDPSMPCFRLGAIGTETERHKRINGMVSFLFATEAAGTALLAESARRLESAGLALAAAQAPSDRPGLCDFYQRYFDRQGAFPVLARRP